MHRLGRNPGGVRSFASVAAASAGGAVDADLLAEDPWFMSGRTRDAHARDRDRGQRRSGEKSRPHSLGHTHVSARGSASPRATFLRRPAAPWRPCPADRCQLANTRTSTGLAAAAPSIVPEQDTGCLIQRGWIRLTQCPLATLARPDAPPLSLAPEPTQCTDHLKLSCSLFGSVTTSRNERGGRTCEKGATKVSVGVALWRTISRP